MTITIIMPQVQVKQLIQHHQCDCGWENWCKGIYLIFPSISVPIFFLNCSDSAPIVSFSRKYSLVFWFSEILFKLRHLNRIVSSFFSLRLFIPSAAIASELFLYAFGVVIPPRRLLCAIVQCWCAAYIGVQHRNLFILSIFICAIQ